jgi:hypothetical protein
MQLVLLFALQSLGTVACLATGIRAIWLCQAMGFVVGLALAVVLALPVLLLGQFTIPVMVGVLGVALLGLVWLARPTRRTGIITVLWALGFTAACLPFVVCDASVRTYDSDLLLRFAGTLCDSHTLALDTADPDRRGIFQIVAHAYALFTDDDVLIALMPAFSISLGATFALVLDRGLRDKLSARARWLAIVVGMLVLLAIPMVRLHAVYIHTNWASAGYWFVFAVLVWLAEVEDDRCYLPIAFLALLAYALNRVENPMFGAVFLAIAVAATRFDRRAFAVPLLVFTALLVGWLCVLVSVVPADSLHLNPAKAMLMIAAVIAVAVVGMLRDLALVRRVLPYALPAIAVASVIGVLALVAIRFDAFRTSFGNWQGDLWLRPYWGYFAWPLFAVLAIGSIWIETPKHTRVLRYMLGMFFVLVVLLTALAPAGYYGSGRYADLNRITVHVVPLLAFYLALSWIPQLSRLRRA